MVLKAIMIAIAAAALAGCNSFAEKGVHTAYLTPDGCVVSSETIYGGPNVECSKDKNGAIRMTVDGSRSQAVKALSSALEKVMP